MLFSALVYEAPQIDFVQRREELLSVFENLSRQTKCTVLTEPVQVLPEDKFSYGVKYKDSRLVIEPGFEYLCQRKENLILVQNKPERLKWVRCFEPGEFVEDLNNFIKVMRQLCPDPGTTNKGPGSFFVSNLYKTIRGDDWSSEDGEYLIAELPEDARKACENLVIYLVYATNLHALEGYLAAIKKLYSLDLYLCSDSWNKGAFAIGREVNVVEEYQSFVLSNGFIQRRKDNIPYISCQNLSDLASALNKKSNGKYYFKVDDVLAKKELLFFGLEYQSPVKTFNDAARLFGLRIVVKDNIYSIKTPKLPAQITVNQIRTTFEAGMPKMFMRAMIAQNDAVDSLYRKQREWQEAFVQGKINPEKQPYPDLKDYPRQNIHGEAVQRLQFLWEKGNREGKKVYFKDMSNLYQADVIWGIAPLFSADSSLEQFLKKPDWLDYWQKGKIKLSKPYKSDDGTVRTNFEFFVPNDQGQWRQAAGAGGGILKGPGEK